MSRAYRSFEPLEDDLMQAVEPAHERVRVAAQVLEVARQDLLQDGELFFGDGLEDEAAVRRVVEKAPRLPAAD